MRAFDVCTGIAVSVRRDNIDTDQICPAEFCKRITKTGFADALFARWREQGGFVLDEPRYAAARFLIAGSGFGIGSSREHAVWALCDHGFRAVFAESFGEIFRNNALGNGLLPIALPPQQLARLAAAAESAEGLELTVDLREQEVRDGAERIALQIDPRARRMILNGLDEIAATQERSAALPRYEAARPAWLPRLTAPRAA
jgi:3-isopropylmalate/(R)-2-methylmalate dehydratase small subunit